MRCFVCTYPINHYNSVLFPDALCDAVYPICFHCMDAYLAVAHQSVHRYVLARPQAAFLYLPFYLK